MSADPRGPGRLRLALLALLLAGGAVLVALLARSRPGSPLEASLATLFQLLGTPVHLVDRLASRAIPVGSLQERQLGTPSGSATKPSSSRATRTRPTSMG